MIIDDNKLLNVLWKENDVLQEYDELDLSNQHILEELAKIKKIKIMFNSIDNLNIIINTIKQLYPLIEKCPNLEFISVFSTSPESKKYTANNLIETLANHHIKHVSIKGFNYHYGHLYESILSSTSEIEVNLDTINNPVDGLKYIFGPAELKKKLKFDSYGSAELDDLYHDLRFDNIISLKNYERYTDLLSNYQNLYISIGNVSEVDLQKLEIIKKDSHIKGIYIKCGSSDDDESKYYTIEEYEKIRKTIDSIIQMIKLPSPDDPNREKKIFAQIYKILGKNIKYDIYATTEEGKKNTQLSYDCRNLKNGLLGVIRDNKKMFLAVCAGYATILQNVCACFGIRCDYIKSESKEVTKPGRYIISGPREYENGTSDPHGHAYNAVYLDGKAYLCDLTNDADDMQLDQIARFFLKSYEEFYQSHKKTGFSSDNVTVITQNGEAIRSIDPSIFVHSCTYEEQIELFGIIAKGNIDEMISEGYLADFALNTVRCIKQVRGKIGMLDYIKLVQMIHTIEEYIKDYIQSEANEQPLILKYKVTDDDGNVVGEESIIFYPGTWKLLPSAAIDEVERMETRQWKIK